MTVSPPSFLDDRNPFDVSGARNAGLQAFWVNRAGNDWVDSATPLRPSRILSGLAELADIMKMGE